MLAPLNIADAVFTTQWACCLAEQLQSVAIVLSDQFLGQSRAIIDKPASHDINCMRKVVNNVKDDYQRYQLVDNGISPMTIPGTEGGMYTADGLEHNIKGTPSSMAVDHLSQLKKRQSKLEMFNYGEDWAEVSGSGKVVMIT